ncbi:PREDICTED: uncharacterized protein LOC105544392 [Mandrillus leucophaeus]|uniref:uncharacterized protein LOC105544392 n=1 Tax=Mandrillus leucophaeus TaxID=9568 RepID=UPI0005F44074|nr:PREDICTED: uncharacterized protein LOC105544392 [Mandrillus leucophaeus]
MAEKYICCQKVDSPVMKNDPYLCLHSLKKSPTHALASSQQFQAIFLEGRELTGRNRPQRPARGLVGFQLRKDAPACRFRPWRAARARPRCPDDRGGLPRGPRSGRQWASRGGGGGGEQEVTAWEPEAGLGRRFGRGGHLAAAEEAFPRGPPCQASVALVSSLPPRAPLLSHFRFSTLLFPCLPLSTPRTLRPLPSYRRPQGPPWQLGRPLPQRQQHAFLPHPDTISKMPDVEKSVPPKDLGDSEGRSCKPETSGPPHEDKSGPEDPPP